jgi:hypothetical protein
MKPATERKPIILKNPRSDEIFFCEDMKNVHIIDGVEFIYVRREGIARPQHLMRKDSLVVVKK